jgi:hypothetical protein
MRRSLEYREAGRASELAREADDARFGVLPARTEPGEEIGGGIPLDRRPVPAENAVTRWLAALCSGQERRQGGGGWRGGERWGVERRFRQLGLYAAYALV